jgi:hypothetical protein
MVGVLFAFVSCQRHSDMQDEGASFLQGVWVQDSIPHQDQLLNYVLHELKFTCDSLYTTMHVHASTKAMPDSCFKEGRWTEYAKAVYVVRGDSLITEGVYTRDNWKQRISGCYKQGQYLPRFKIVRYTADSLVLQNRFDSNPMILRKTADIICIPKKRWEY